MRRGNEGGETLVEILIALVIMGLVVGAIFATYATASTSTKSQRDFVTADSVLRDYAEATNQAVRTTCAHAVGVDPAGTAFTVSYTPPVGFSVAATGLHGLTCPSLTTVNEIDITTTFSGTKTRTLQIDVRTP